jgi:hypothetical protein
MQCLTIRLPLENLEISEGRNPMRTILHAKFGDDSANLLAPAPIRNYGTPPSRNLKPR